MRKAKKWCRGNDADGVRDSLAADGSDRLARYAHQRCAYRASLSEHAILGALQKEKIISISRGVGGAHLIRDPETLAAWEVYHAVELDGLEDLLRFHPNPSPQCPVGKRIKSVLEKPYQEIGTVVQDTMEKIMLQQLLDDYYGVSQEMLDSASQ